jgi:hypothetical protein
MVLFLRLLQHVLLIVGVGALVLGAVLHTWWLVGLGAVWGLLALLVGHWIHFFQQGDKA